MRTDCRIRVNLTSNMKWGHKTRNSGEDRTDVGTQMFPGTLTACSLHTGGSVILL